MALHTTVITYFASYRRWFTRAYWTAQFRQHPIRYTILAVLLVLWVFCLPRPLFNDPYSAVIADRNDELLGARIATDGQWRFPMGDSLSEKYIRCLIAFEDRRFWYHPGVDPVAVVRAFVQNYQSGKIASGGSTLTMQVIRMARNNPSRTFLEKCLELCMATRLELTYRKQSILKLYAAHAPYGGNVVGVEAASWRYFGKKNTLLSWAEAATLAVLPNSPGLIHPGRQRDALMHKRNRLLQHLCKEGQLSEEELVLAQSEPLPEAPQALPAWAPHLLDKMSLRHPWFKGNKGFRTTLDRALQVRVTQTLIRRQELYRGNQIHNLAAVVIDVPTGDVLAYVGNVPGAGIEHGENVDIANAPRSTGSILKPYLYAFSLENGDILPNSLLADLPTSFGSYRPENYRPDYDGAVSARRALIRSLNVPFVHLLKTHGVEKTHFELQQIGLTTLNKGPDHYGLTLILGGAEANLIDLTNSYACMARRLGQFYTRNGRNDANDFRPPRWSPQQPLPRPRLQTISDGLSAGAIWHTFLAMEAVERPNSTGDWESFEASRRIAWKTGTSFGFRDAWAVGCNARYAVGVWVGNADGEGRPGLLGVEMAAPVLFEIFEHLPGQEAWFDPPYDDMTPIEVCRQSGFRSNAYCESDTLWVPRGGLKAMACPYHQLLHLSPDQQWQVNSNCEIPAAMSHRPWFVLPAAQEYFFRAKNPAYQPPPPFRPDCIAQDPTELRAPLQLIYPASQVEIYVPRELNGKLGKVVFKAAHRDPQAELFWHLDAEFMGTTRTFHQMALQPAAGEHLLTLVDAQGNRLTRKFSIRSGNSE
jgi:penicillin-binding protein 1C